MRYEFTLFGRECSIWQSGHDDPSDCRLHMRLGELRTQVQYGISRHRSFRWHLNFDDNDDPITVGGSLGKLHAYLLLDSPALVRLRDRAVQLGELTPTERLSWACCGLNAGAAGYYVAVEMGRWL